MKVVVASTNPVKLRAVQGAFAPHDSVFATVNSKHGGGAYGLLTDGRLTRECVYCQTLTVALVPFVNDLYVSPGESSGSAVAAGYE